VSSGSSSTSGGDASSSGAATGASKARSVLWIAASVVVVVVAVVIIVWALRPTSWTGALTSVSYRQIEAVPNFDESMHTTTDPARLTALTKVLKDNGWTPGATVGTGDGGCAGGIETQLVLALGDGSTSKLTTYRCGDGNGALTRDVTSLVSSWRASG
jgi:hypothetical protein